MALAPGFDGNASGVLSSERGNKPVWGSMPMSNGTIDSGLVVLGSAILWPALSESAGAPTRPSFDGSVSVLGSSSSSMPRNVTDHGDDFGRSDSFCSNGDHSSPSSTSSLAESSLNNAEKKHDKGNYRNWNHRPHGWVDQGDRQRRHGGNSRKGNYYSKRDENRGDHECSFYRPVNIKDSHEQPSYLQSPVMKPNMPTMMPYVGPPPVFQHFPAPPMSYPDTQPQMHLYPTYTHPQTFGGHSFVPSPIFPAMQQPVFFPSLEQTRTLILKQIEFYFSKENLCRDVFLRRNMDDHGWVPINVIAGFNRIMQLTNSIPLVLDAITSSDVVEVEEGGKRIRRRDQWEFWLLKPRLAQGSTKSDAIPAAEAMVGSSDGEHR